MDKETETKTNTAPTASANTRPGAKDRNSGRPPRRAGSRSFGERVKDVDQKILEIRRVTRVVAGGRRMSFAVSMLIGDKNGVVGLGTGKGGDTALAISKALKDAKKNAIKIKTTEKKSIPHSVSAKYSSSSVTMFPNGGKGLVLGAALRDIAIMSGLRDVSGKVLSGSKNKLNTARATMKALSGISKKYIFGAQKIESAVPAVATEEVAKTE
jgi:small subunit ribosomal protein S5